MSDVVVEKFSDAGQLVDAAAARLVDTIVEAQKTRGVASIVLTGGGTGIALLEKLRKTPGDIDWAQIDLYWGDERFLPAGDPERNEVQAREALLDHVPVDPDRVHPMAASDGIYEGDPDGAATAYEQLLGAQAHGKQVPTFDVHLLGMGGEGHINSLFPHTDAVREESRFVVAVTDSPKPPPVRITLTLPAVQRAKEVWLLISGAAKAEAVAAAVGGAAAVDWPCAGATGLVATRWFLDSDAASQLP
ncbi:6-phosphogluconolactonase [Rhodococcus sp. ACPA4]|uniref:6-phosphogluconolactonase n=1 Tax=unclassified Rhodococcus (in: high G+C Gram-positive bacteria) TaxID=192944 RepID=UPI000BB11D2D|nr:MULTISPECIES: 6-phosphogluconolactonase [unclassified Rhodococcus (in: high G+C Gram-positive bacteria)]NRI64535.1 6-phosphogluconolactonase [Rhodococcus sp. MS16]PBC41050.1 6-phosphogluconolactonase [Rhodococcus sp. ACPA4]ROZ45787.1 6-phosphogluconolactonase [Rhodococcus sp. WS3]